MSFGQLHGVLLSDDMKDLTVRLIVKMTEVVNDECQRSAPGFSAIQKAIAVRATWCAEFIVCCLVPMARDPADTAARAR